MDQTKQSLETVILSIQQGESEERNHLISTYRDFIKSELSKVTGAYIDESDELYSVGLDAFNEAIDRYNGKKGGFISYAAVVIRSRAIDHLRKVSRENARRTTLDEGAEQKILNGGGMEKPFEDRLETQLEIDALKDRLERFGITLEDLITRGPKQERTRKKSMKVAKALYRDEELRDRFQRTMRLPMKALRRKTFVGMKTIEENREYIIALYCILDSSLEELKNYLPKEESS